VNKGALRTLTPQNPKVQSIFRNSATSLPTAYRLNSCFQMLGTYSVVHWPQYQAILLYYFLAKGDFPILHTIQWTMILEKQWRMDSG
jgi:hypothetical protein